MDALEERTGVSKRTISEIERGMRVPQTLTLAKLAHALGVDLDELVEEEVSKEEAAPPPLSPSASGPEAEEAQRRRLPYVRPWFELWNSLSERWQADAKSGALTVGAAQEARETHKNVMAAMNMALHQLESEGIDPMTGPIGQGLEESMLRLMSAQQAMGAAGLQHLEESPLAQARIGKRKAEPPQVEHEEHAKRDAG